MIKYPPYFWAFRGWWVGQTKSGKFQIFFLLWNPSVIIHSLLKRGATDCSASMAIGIVIGENGAAWCARTVKSEAVTISTNSKNKRQPPNGQCRPPTPRGMMSPASPPSRVTSIPTPTSMPNAWHNGFAIYQILADSQDLMKIF